MSREDDIGKIRQIRAQYPAFCMSCSELVHPGDEVFWCIDVGVWHLDCSAPKNLKLEIAEAKAAKRLGRDTDPGDEDDYVPPEV